MSVSNVIAPEADSMPAVLRTLRVSRGWTLRDLQWITGLSFGYLCDLERGRRQNPSLATIKRLALAYGITTSDLMGRLEGTK